MAYTLDLNRISLNAYREFLQGRDLLPSRRLLLDGLEEKLAQLEAFGIGTVAELLRALSSPAKIAGLATKSGIPADYLKILKREAGTLKPKRVSLKDFPDVDSALIESLRKRNIRTAGEYLKSEPDEDDELYCLCALSQINGVGPNAARMLYSAGYRSPAEVAAADAQTMLDRISAVNASRRYYQGTLGEKDMQYCIDYAEISLRYSDI